MRNKKSEVQKLLQNLKNFLSDDTEAVSSIDLLLAKVEQAKWPEQKSSTATENSGFPLPEEIKNLPKAFAIFSDGACRGNPGPGAWAVLIQNEKEDCILKSSGIDLPTTNNKMELEGAIRGLKGLVEKWIEEGISDRDTPVFLYSDSKYVVDGISSWVPGWKARGWKKADNKEPENILLWKELDQLKEMFTSLKFIWIKGHAGHPQNEYCDKLANEALDEAGY